MSFFGQLLGIEERSWSNGVWSREWSRESEAGRSKGAMSAKRPERKESGEWAVHLRPDLKKRYWKKNRKAGKKNGGSELKYSVEYDNDTGPNDEGFSEFWNVVCGVVEICRCRDEANATMIANALNDSGPLTAPKQENGSEVESPSRSK